MNNFNIIKSVDGIKTNYAGFKTMEAANKELELIAFSYRTVVEDGVIEYTEDDDTVIRFEIIEFNY